MHGMGVARLVITVLCVCFCVLSAAAQSANDPGTAEARELLQQGVDAYKQGDFKRAIELFEKCVALEPYRVNSRLYLATAHASQYIPGAPNEENRGHADKAVEEFREVIRIDPTNLSAIDGIGSILFQVAGSPYDPDRFKESLQYFKRHIELSPADPEPHYWVCVIAWTLSFRANGEIRVELRKATQRQALRKDEPLPEYARREFERDFGPIVDEGIEHLRKAMELREDYEDAMAYLNLLYRQKADMAPIEVEREEWLARADELVDQVKAIKMKKMGLDEPRKP